ncbi:peptidoglycan-binding protein [Streptomyces sp. YIM 98790]|uniref:peptidoglycan-binding domain-containing protein n=1 Tax=Streptomyces sp. YIM 98790 TaxID=2689077 RepID=UPI00140E4204|nr:peptidoglycan-binding domain-containing protein [Streptomyces sp. YIM 98790]
MKRKLAACAVGALTVATLALSTSPAAASGDYSGRAYVFGAGSFTDDWGDEGLLSTSSHTYSNATCLWQKILWADGYLNSTADIDGIFGAKTRNATVALQRDFGLGDDGVVGKETFGWADRWLVYESGSTTSGSTLKLTYVGLVRNITITRDASGRHGFYDGDGNRRLAGYNYRTCA